MKKTMRYLFLLVGLLMSTTGSAYKIEKVIVSYGSVTPITYYDGGSNNVTVNDTDIPAHKTVTMTVTPNDGYYLSSLVYEEVSPLDVALARRRTPDIKPIHNITIPTTNTTYLTAHFGGSYSFEMPENNVIITATFELCTSIIGANLYWDSWDGTSALPKSKVYDGAAHTMIVKVGGTELTKDRHYTTTAYTLTNVGSITPTITGIGEYNGSISGTTTLSITQQPLTITANSQTISYGSSIQTGISQVTTIGLVAGDALTSITLAPSTSQVTTTGTITPSGATTTKGISNYDVSYVTGLLTIGQKDLSAIATVTFTQDYYNYDGSAHQPSIDNTEESNMKVYYGNTRLVQGTDFTASYTTTNSIYTHGTDYTTPDIFYITITFTGNYSGTKKVQYQIRKEILLSNDHRWITYYDPLYNTYVPEGSGFEVYTIKNITNTGIELHERRDYIKAGVPVLIYRTGDTVSFFPELVESCDASISSNNAYIGVNTDGGIAVLSITGTDYDIWILVDDQFVRTNSGTIPDGKCYLKLPKADFYTPSLALSRTFTSIDPIEYKEMQDDVIYDLSGRRVSNPQKGLYIQNGKKIIIK